MQRNRFLAIWLRLLAEVEVRAKRGAKAILTAQGSSLENAYISGGQSAAEQVLSEGKTAWVRFLVANYSTVTLKFATFINEQLGVKPKKASFADRVQGFIARNAYKKSDYITETSRNIIKKIISEGVAKEQSVTQIAKDIRSQFIEGVADSRADMIARTEVHLAATYGGQSAAEDSGIDMMREWVAVLDDRTRPAHAEADGDQVEMDEPFDIDGEEIMIPGEGSAENSINCRCAVAYIPKITMIEGDDGSGELI